MFMIFENVFTWWKQVVIWMQNLWNKFMKRIEILILKFFDIIYVCVKSIVKKWCDILIINRK
jgi:hypothetical protein